jgi:hypothetical protein
VDSRDEHDSALALVTLMLQCASAGSWPTTRTGARAPLSRQNLKEAGVVKDEMTQRGEAACVSHQQLHGTERAAASMLRRMPVHPGPLERSEETTGMRTGTEVDVEM